MSLSAPEKGDLILGCLFRALMAHSDDVRSAVESVEWMHDAYVTLLHVNMTTMQMWVGMRSQFY